ncbi:MAG: hypothetical protein ACRCWJ_07525 [Casimicrobium sp.]
MTVFLTQISQITKVDLRRFFYRVFVCVMTQRNQCESAQNLRNLRQKISASEVATKNAPPKRQIKKDPPKRRKKKTRRSGSGGSREKHVGVTGGGKHPYVVKQQGVLRIRDHQVLQVREALCSRRRRLKRRMRDQWAAELGVERTQRNWEKTYP